MASISIEQLAFAMCRKNFAELVSYQISTTAYQDLKMAINGAKSCLTPEIQLEVDEIIGNCSEITVDRSFWNNDCGLVIKIFTTMTEKHLSDRLIDASEKELIEIFHIIVMHCAHRARKDPRLLSFVNKTSGTSHQRPIYQEHPTYHA